MPANSLTSNGADTHRRRQHYGTPTTLIASFKTVLLSPRMHTNSERHSPAIGHRLRASTVPKIRRFLAVLDLEGMTHGN